MSNEEKEKVRAVIRKRLEEGYSELGDVDEDAAHEHLDYDDWMEQHQDTEARLIDSKILTFTNWRQQHGFDSDEGGGGGGVRNSEAPHPNGGSLQHFRSNADSYGTLSREDGAKLAVLDYVLGTMDRHGRNIMYEDDKPIAIDNGYSMPASDTPDGFQFRSDPVRGWLRGDTNVPQSEREPLLEALNKTDWQALVDRHPSMNSLEREALLGRVENMKEALRTDDGLASLWSRQELMSGW